MRFFKNLPDDLHCFQAVFLMLLSVFFPKKKFSFKFVDKISGFKKGHFTIDTQAFLWLAKQGFEFIRITDFDEKKFIKQGEKYLTWYWRPDVYERNKKSLNFKEMRFLSKLLAKHTTFFVRLPTTKDVSNLLKENYLVVAHINPKKLNKTHTDTIHSVLVTKESDKFFTIQNPGLPPEENKRVSKKRLASALYEVVGVRKVLSQKKAGI